MLSLYPVPGTIFCVVQEPSNLIFPAPSSCSPLPLHLSGLWGGFIKIIRIKGGNKKTWQALLGPVSRCTAVAGMSRPKEQPSHDRGASPSVTLPWVPTFAYILPQLPVFIPFFLQPKGIWQALHLNAYSSVINIIQARNMGEAVPTPLISGLEIAEKRCRGFLRGAEAGERSGSEHRLRSWISWDQILALPLTRWVPWLFHASYSLPIKWEYYYSS